MSNWTLNPEYATGASGKAFTSLDAVFALEGELVSRDPLSRVLKVRVGNRYYYVKRYHGAGKHLRRFVGRPRIRAEWENLLHFRAWGIPVATVVGFGLERRCGAFHRGALITRELVDRDDLANLARIADPRLRNPHWVAHVSRQVALATRTMHDQGFAHNDLKWRNILVDSEPLANISLIDCPSGSFWWGPFLEYRKIKDLACLDKLARYHLSRTQRLRFYKTYTGRPCLSATDRRCIRRIVGFFEGRE